MPPLAKSATALFPVMVGLAAASLLLVKSPAEPRPTRFGRVRRPGNVPAHPRLLPMDFTGMRRRLLGLAPVHVRALLGPPRATAVAATEESWYYPLGRSDAGSAPGSAHGAMAIQFDRTRHATAVEFVPTPG